MVPKFLLEKKREGHALGTAEIREFIVGFTKGEIPDYQMAAMAMAICCRGMNERETADLTDAMMRSGRCLEWDVNTADKHSTGGVGDKLSFIIQPLVSACGICVPSLCGRGLGITGGTADKLETIPGLSCSQSLDEMQRIAKEVGVAMTVQTDEITPADKKLYALRDVTGTVVSIPLIVGSVLSKKLAEGADTIVFDVKCGSGAFMKTREQAVTLANALVNGARTAGRKSAALVTDMNSPLGLCVGNALEIRESISWLSGEVKCPEVELSVELAAMMVSLGKDMPLEDARSLCKEKLADGSAYERFLSMIKAQGGDMERFERAVKKPTFKFRIQAMRSGYITKIDAEKVGKVALELGAGRKTAEERIDPLAGITLAVRVGSKVAVGDPIATLEKSADPEGLEKCAAELYKAFAIGSEAPQPQNLILERIG